MELDIRAIDGFWYERAHAFQCEYLDQETFAEFRERVTSHPDLYFVALHGSELAGVCYGQPSEKDGFAVILQGIAVNLDETKRYARVGIGSRLLAVFESAAIRQGYRKSSVGAADDPKVEAFYLKNGFTPVELVVKGMHHEELERVGVAEYQAGNIIREELRRKHNPREVIFIFEKALK